VTVEEPSKPFWLSVAASAESNVSGVQPVGSSQRSIVKVTLPSAFGIIWVAPPTLNVCNVSPSQLVCDVGSRLHSSNLRGWPASSVLLAAIVTVRTPASPSYAPVPGAKTVSV